MAPVPPVAPVAPVVRLRPSASAPPVAKPLEPMEPTGRAEEGVPAEAVRAPAVGRPRLSEADRAALPTVAPARGEPFPDFSPDEPGETVVQVTIGRIDVRARAPSTSPALPAPRPSPRLGLADYLKGREERRR